MTRPSTVTRAALLVATAAISSPWAVPASGQVTLRDLVVSGGVSAEGYQGNLPTAGAVVRDSTELASAVAGEVGLRGSFVWRRAAETRGTLSFDGGVRQFSARGFELRDYAPREWSGSLDGLLVQRLGQTVMLNLFAGVRGREVQDRPPMPLFLQPAYAAYTGGVQARVGGAGTYAYDLMLSGERMDFFAPSHAPQVRLLDRNAMGAEAGVIRAIGGEGELRVHAGIEAGRYPRQNTFDDADPVREDRTFRGGATWTNRGEILTELGLQGRLNRSNSRRPEYNSITLQGVISAPIPGDAILTAYAALTLKRYLEATESARLLPGDEANSASLAYVSLSRGLARNLDGAVRVGWTRAETELGGEYFQRFGGTFVLHYRPGA